jgi:hypothetical protein
MKRLKTTILVVILMVLATFTIGIAVEANLLKNQQKENSISDQKHIKNIGQSTLFDAKITFYVLTGEGCACTPIPGVSIIATGGEGNDSGITDNEGKCILTLVINGEYQVYIDAEGYQKNYFEFNVIDDQTFTFHLFEKKDTSSSSLPLLYHLVRNIIEK